MLLAFAPIEFWPACLVAIVPLVWVAIRKANPSPNPRSQPGGGFETRRVRKREAVLVSLGASAFYWVHQHWVIEVSAAGYGPMVLYLSIYPGLFVYLLNRLRRSYPRIPLGLLVPIVWTGVEWLRGEAVWDGYAWYMLAHPLIDAPLLAGLGAVVGQYGVGAIIAAWVGAIWDLTLDRSRAAAVVAGVVALATIGMAALGISYSKQPASAEMNVGLVQTNLPQSNKIGWSMEQRVKDFARFVDLTKQAAASDPKPDLIVWPETMFPGYFLDPIEFTGSDGKVQHEPFNAFVGRLLDLQRDIKIPMLVGALGTDRLRVEPGDSQGRVLWDARYNSVFEVRDGKVEPRRYDKIRLTPFGETMPYISAWPWLEQKLLAIGAAGMSFDLASGTLDKTPVFSFSGRDAAGHSKSRVGATTPICFEITESNLCREMVRRIERDGAVPLLVNLTNDGWFGRSELGRRTHNLAARWRALELGVSVVRAANTGISSFTEFMLDDRMRAGVAGGAFNVDGVLAGRVQLFDVRTPFRMIGDLSWVCSVLLGGLLVGSFWRRKSNTEAGLAGSMGSHGGIA